MKTPMKLLSLALISLGIASCMQAMEQEKKPGLGEYLWNKAVGMKDYVGEKISGMKDYLKHDVVGDETWRQWRKTLTFGRWEDPTSMYLRRALMSDNPESAEWVVEYLPAWAKKEGQGVDVMFMALALTRDQDVESLTKKIQALELANQDINKNIGGTTPLRVALRQHNKVLARLLQERGAVAPTGNIIERV